MSRHYFQKVPDFRYKNPESLKYDRNNYITVKNIFLRAKLRDDVLNNISFLNKYTIKEGERPEDVAEKLYGDKEYDWVIFITNNMTNVRTDWPMTGKQLYDYCYNKYGGDLNATQYYETKEVRDSQNRLVMPAGKIVDRDFTIPDPDNPNIRLGVGIPLDDPFLIGITNYLVETRENEKKRNIKIIKPEYLTQFMTDLTEIFTYDKSSQYESRTVKKAST